MSFLKKIQGSASSISQKVSGSASGLTEKASGSESMSSLTEKLSGSASSLSGELSGGSLSSGLDFGKTVMGYVPIVSSVLENPKEMASDVVASGGDILYFVYFMLGAGFLLPWNAFITAVDYFDYLYPNSHIDRVFSVAYLVPCLSALALLILYGKNVGAQTRINGGLTLFFLGIAAIPAMEAFVLHGEQGNAWTYSVTVFAVVLGGIGDSLVQGTLVGSAGLLPARYMQAIVSGTGLSGLLISVLRIVTKACFENNSQGLRASADIYFSVSLVFLALCLVLYNVAQKLGTEFSYYKEMKSATSAGVAQALAEEANEQLDLENRADSLRHSFEAKASNAIFLGQKVPTSAIALGSSSDEQAFQKGKDFVLQKFEVKQTFLRLKWLAGGMVLTYVITLAIFPGYLTEDVKSSALGDWYPVLLLSAYNLFDFVGKTLYSSFVPSKPDLVIGWSVARVLLIPLFAVCVHGPEIFRSEVPVFFLTALLGVSNGYLTTCFFVFAPQLVDRIGESETAGFIMVISLEVGLTVGSLLGWFWVI